MNNTDVNVLNNVNAEPNLVSDQLNAFHVFSVSKFSEYKRVL